MSLDSIQTSTGIERGVVSQTRKSSAVAIKVSKKARGSPVAPVPPNRDIEIGVILLEHRHRAWTRLVLKCDVWKI